MNTSTMQDVAKWVSDPAHSAVRFSVRHMMFAEVQGQFTQFNAALYQTNGDFTGARIEATIEAASINTANNDRDAHLRSADFFEVEKYPVLTFASTVIKKTSDNRYTIEGDLSMHGVTKSVTLDAQFLGEVTDPWGNQRVGFEASTTIDRHDFDLKWNAALETGGVMVSKEVKISLNMQLTKQK